MDKNISVQLKIQDERIEGELRRIISSMDKAGIKDSEEMGAPDLIVLQIGKNLKEDIQALHSLKNESSAPEVFLIAPVLETQMLVEFRRAGANRIFIQPFKKEEVRDALLKFKDEKNASSSAPKGRKSGKIIYIIGCKGGVGTTTVALNLASSLAEQDKSRSVLLTDITLPFGDIPTLLNIKPSPDWAQLSKNIFRIDSTSLKSLLFEHPHGFYVLPSPTGVNEGQRIRPEAVEKLLSVLQETYDFILLDGGKSLSENSLKILEMAETVFLITGLSNPCIANVKRLFSITQSVAPCLEEKIKIVVNRYQKSSSNFWLPLEEDLNEKIFWKIPNDYQTALGAIKQGKTITQVGKGKEIHDAFMKIAAFVLEGGEQTRAKKEFWERFQEKAKLPKAVLSAPYKP